MHQSDECFLFVDTGGERWPCPSGAIIGRAGDVAPDHLRNVDTLSRQHLRVEKRGASWFVIALKEGRNSTRMDGKAMVKGQAYPLMGVRTFQVDTFQFYLAAAAGLPTEIWQRPDDFQTQTKPKRKAAEAPAEDPAATGVLGAEKGARPVWPIAALPLPAAWLDEGHRIKAANAAALEMLGAGANGRVFESFFGSSDAASLRDALAGAADDARTSSLTLVLMPHGSPSVEIEVLAAQSDGAILVTWRDVGARRARERRLAEKVDLFASRGRTLARLAGASSMIAGDCDASFALIGREAVEHFPCHRCRVWLCHPGAAPSLFHAAGGHPSADASKPIDLAAIPALGDALDERGWAVVTASSHQFKTLHPSGFSHERPTVLIVTLEHGPERFGLITFERQTSAEWGEDDRAFAQCLAGYAVTALVSRRRA